MKCKTIVGISAQGKPIVKPKEVYDSIGKASEVAEIMTRRSKVYKVVPYYCERHKGFHVGASHEFKKSSPQVKIIGHIKLVEKLQKKVQKTASIVADFQKKSGIFSTIWGLFEYHEKDKILVVILPDGTVKKPKLNVVLLGSGNKHQRIKRFIKTEYLPLFKHDTKRNRIKIMLKDVND